MAILLRQTRALSPVTPDAVVKPTLVFVSAEKRGVGKATVARPLRWLTENRRRAYVLRAYTRDWALE